MYVYIYKSKIIGENIHIRHENHSTNFLCTFLSITEDDSVRLLSCLRKVSLNSLCQRYKIYDVMLKEKTII